MQPRHLTLVADGSVRTYLGDEGWYWVIVRRGGGRRVRLDLVDRILVEAADGSRAEEEHRRFAERLLGRPLPPREASERLERLVAEGALGDGVTTEGLPEAVAWRPNLITAHINDPRAASLRVATVAGTRVGCDGGGGCCRLLDRIALDADDVAHLHDAWPDEALTPGGLSVDSALRSERDGSFTLGVRAGACLLLEEDGRCGAHARLGSDGKPAVCRSYPLSDILCDDEFAVGLALECRCAIDFATRGEPIEAGAETLLARRRAHGEAEEVAAEIGATVERRMTRAAYLAWRAAARVRAAATTTIDPVAWALGEAAFLVAGEPGSAREAARRVGGEVATRAALPRAFAPIVEALGDHFARDADDAARVYSVDDLQIRALRWGADAARALGQAIERGTAPASPEPGERLLLEQTLFAHGLLRARSLSTGLCALALRLALARAAAEPLPVFLLPLSTIEYLFRAHGASELVDRFGVPLDEALGATR